MERTEELGLAGRLPISVGGQQVALRTLNLDESEQWQEKFANFDVGVAADTKEIQKTTDAMLDLVEAYDVDHVLGTRESLRKRLNRRELYDAINQMARAELPFLADSPSVEREFGQALASQLMLGQFRQASSTNGSSPTVTPLTSSRSERRSRRNGSSSSGPTASAA